MTNAMVARQLIGLYTVAKLASELLGIRTYPCNLKSARRLIEGHGNCEKIDVCNCLVDYYKISRFLIETPIYYKSKVAKYIGKIQRYVYDESDALLLCTYFYQKECS